MKTKKETKQAISLIVLVITIIVLIILAGAIVLTLNNNGIIDKANEAVKEYNLDEVEQVASLAWAEAYLDGARTQQELETAVKNTLTKNKITEADYDGYSLKVTESGVELVKIIPAGLYESGSNYTILLKDWATLISENVIWVEGGTLDSHGIDGPGNATAEALTGELVLPSDGSITVIGDHVFYLCGELTNVVIPYGITTIEDRAFCDSGINSLVIPNSVTTIGEDIIENCSINSTIIIPDSVVKIGNYAFGTGWTKEIIVEVNITYVPESAFNCDKLTLPASVKRIEICGLYGIESINFKGTKAQWNAIEFETDWNQGCNEFIVICTDGTITIPAWEES